MHTWVQGKRGCFLTLIIALGTLGIVGCGQNPTDVIAGGDSGGAPGPDTLASTVVDGEYGEFELVARQASDGGSGQWNFAVEQGRQTTKNDLRFVWDFGDDSQPEGTEQSYVYDQPGDYTVRVYAYKPTGVLAFVLSLHIQIVAPSNESPVASAGSNTFVNENELVFLFAAGSTDPDGDDLTFTWAQTSGTPVQILDPNTHTASFVSPIVDEDEVLSFQVSVSDGKTNSKADVTVTINDAGGDDAAPSVSANAGPDQDVVSGGSVTLDGSLSTSDGGSSPRFRWRQVEGPAVALLEDSQALASFFALDVPDDMTVELVFELLVVADGVSSTDEVSIFVHGEESIIAGNDPRCRRDSDGDGVSDCRDQCPNATDKDSDGDGAADCIDKCPADKSKAIEGQCGCGVRDIDSDSDAVADCVDGCPADTLKTTPGNCGCGKAESVGCGTACKLSSTSWQNSPFIAQRGRFTAEFDAEPSESSIDGVVGMSSGQGSNFSAFAAIVRFNPAGEMDVRNGDFYDADMSVVYQPGKNYHFRIAVDMVTHTYSVHVTPEGGTERALAQSYSFRDEQSAITSINQWAVWSETTGAINLCNFAITDVPLDAAAGADVTLAVGASKQLNGKAVGGVPPYMYSWSPTVGLSNPLLPTPTASPTVTTTYTLTVRDSEGRSDSDSVKVTIEAPDALTANAGPDKSVTAGDSATLQGSAMGGRAPYTYRWVPVSALSSPTVAAPTVTPLATTNFILTVTDADLNTDTDVVTVTVQAAAALSANAGGDKSTTPGVGVALSGSASGGTAPYTYRWSPATGLSSATVANPTASPTATTTYTLTVTDSAAKTATDSVAVTVSTTSTTANYYVDKASGNDSNAGSASSPWKTLSKAASTARAGQTVLVKAGTYTETLRPTASGTTGNLITFKGEQGAVIDGGNSRSYGVDLSRPSSFIRIEGFEIKNHTDAGINFQDWGSTGVTGIEILRCYIHHNAGDAINARNVTNSLISDNEIYANGLTAVAFGGQNGANGLTARNNDIHYNGKDGFQGGGRNLLFENNKLYDQCHTDLHQDAFDTSNMHDTIIRYNTMSDFTQLVYMHNLDGGFTNVQIYGNVFFNDKYFTTIGGETSGVFVDGNFTSNPISNITIHSNTFAWTGYAGVWVYGNAKGVKVRNNVFYDSGLDVDVTDMSQVTSDYNLFYNSPKPSYEKSNSVTGNPQFNNYVRHQSWDFKLKSTSPAIDKGDPSLETVVTVPADFKDMLGTSRPQNNRADIGAYEYKP